MAFASLTDVNKQLPDDKAQAQDADIPNLGISADRLIRARLAGVVEIDTILEWVDPENTPEIIREISGLLVAAQFYAKLVAEDEADGSAFAQELYDRATGMLEEIREGTLVILGIDNTEIETSSIDASFWPNDTTQPPFFAVADQWA